MRIKFFSMVFVFCLLFVNCAEPAANAPELKQVFMKLYHSEWKVSNFNYDLFRIIDKEFDEITGKMLFGTKGLQLAINKHNVIEKILADISSRFQPEYELFFKNFYDKYYELLDTEPAKYSHEKLKELLFYEDVASIQPEVWQKKLDNIGIIFEKRLSMPYISAVLVLLGIIIFLCRGLLTKNLRMIPHKKERRIKFIAGITGIVIMILGALQFSRWLFFAQGVTRDFIYEETKDLYTSELPESFWAFIQPYVIDSAR